MEITLVVGHMAYHLNSRLPEQREHLVHISRPDPHVDPVDISGIVMAELHGFVFRNPIACGIGDPANAQTVMDEVRVAKLVEERSPVQTWKRRDLAEDRCTLLAPICDNLLQGGNHPGIKSLRITLPAFHDVIWIGNVASR
jgi:hypothetical protein